jgi:hypothetical protein
MSFIITQINETVVANGKTDVTIPGRLAIHLVRFQIQMADEACCHAISQRMSVARSSRARLGASGFSAGRLTAAIMHCFLRRHQMPKGKMFLLVREIPIRTKYADRQIQVHSDIFPAL